MNATVIKTESKFQNFCEHDTVLTVHDEKASGKSNRCSTNQFKYLRLLKRDSYILTISWTRRCLNLIPCHTGTTRLIRTLPLFNQQN